MSKRQFEISQENWENMEFLAAGEFHLDEKSRRKQRRERKEYDKPAKYRKNCKNRELAEIWD